MNQMKVDDKIGTLNNSLRKLSSEMKDALMENKDFVALNQTLQDIVQEELMKLVKGTLNQNPQVTQNIDRQM